MENIKVFTLVKSKAKLTLLLDRWLHQTERGAAVSLFELQSSFCDVFSFL